ncbi:MAG: HD domain-containing protein, partial [Planctomycetota bacterium]
ARREERNRWGETNFILRPNVKASRGGLRDIQLIRWIGFSWLGERNLDQLRNRGGLTQHDYDHLMRSYWYFTRLRNELHFRRGKAQNVLDRHDQMDIAEDWGFEGKERTLAVELFMQQYFEHTRSVRYAAAHFVSSSRYRPFLNRSWEYLRSQQIDANIRLGPKHIWVEPRVLPRFASDLPDVMRLMVLSNRYNRRIAHPTWDAIRSAMQQRETTPPDSASVDAFLDLMASPNRLASLLRRMNELGILHQIVPAVKRTRGLVQFNEYHKFTVDEHCIRAVDAATDLVDDDSLIGRLYREIQDKRLLHLALLLHDLGKGFDESHSEVGARIAVETAGMLGLDAEATETLRWLVHKHLLMNHLAFRHDLNDGQILLQFARDVGSVERLAMLTVLSVADLSSVGPGVLTDWKQKLLENLYERTERYFINNCLPDQETSVMTDRRGSVIKRLAEDDAPETCTWAAQHLPLGMLIRGSEEDVVEELMRLAPLKRSDTSPESLAWISYDEDRDVTRVAVFGHLSKRPIGSFARVAGVLASFGLQVLRAEIEKVGSTYAWDTFFVNDPDHQEGTPPSRRQEICQRLVEVVDQQLDEKPRFRSTWKRNAKDESGTTLIQEEKVVFDNQTSRQFTILSLFAYDRPGLLYRLARSIADM